MEANLDQRNVLVLGCGTSGLAMARWCAGQGANVTVADTREAPPQLGALKEAVPQARFISGEFQSDLTEGQHFVLRSPGLSPAQVAPVVDAARAIGLPVAGELALFGMALAKLKGLGIDLKMVTGDNRAVAVAVAAQVGLAADRVVTGPELARLTDRGLQRRARGAEVFAEMDPPQKERLILALRATGTAVGYLGDGINDAAALHAADVGISVDTAVDVTRRAADVVLLRKDLGVLADGVAEGRRAFANTLSLRAVWRTKWSGSAAISSSPRPIQ